MRAAYSVHTKLGKWASNDSQAGTVGYENYLGLKFSVNGSRHQLHSLGEQVIQQTHEDASVICCQLAQVEISQSTQQHLSTQTMASHWQ